MQRPATFDTLARRRISSCFVCVFAWVWLWLWVCVWVCRCVGVCDTEAAEEAVKSESCQQTASQNCRLRREKARNTPLNRTGPTWPTPTGPAHPRWSPAINSVVCDRPLTSAMGDPRALGRSVSIHGTVCILPASLLFPLSASLPPFPSTPLFFYPLFLSSPLLSCFPSCPPPCATGFTSSRCCWRSCTPLSRLVYLASRLFPCTSPAERGRTQTHKSFHAHIYFPLDTSWGRLAQDIIAVV